MQTLDANGLTEEEFLAQYDADRYPKPSLTADILVFRRTREADVFDLLLIRRKGHPYIGCWALPGGFAECGETIEQTAARELEEETGVTGLPMQLVGVYSRPGRDPRGWTVSAAYMALIGVGSIRPEAGDDAAEVCWAQVKIGGEQPEVMVEGTCINDALAFDHAEIITDAARAVAAAAQRAAEDEAAQAAARKAAEDEAEFNAYLTDVFMSGYLKKPSTDDFIYFA